ncbi:MAG TPA: hypothetical protein VIC29_01330 [Steroidobacteraceae bacterium]|jgi:hypothetical protein
MGVDRTAHVQIRISRSAVDRESVARAAEVRRQRRAKSLIELALPACGRAWHGRCTIRALIRLPPGREVMLEFYGGDTLVSSVLSYMQLRMMAGE